MPIWGAAAEEAAGAAAVGGQAVAPGVLWVLWAPEVPEVPEALWVPGVLWGASKGAAGWGEAAG
ncbi:hypothetical protein [Cryptosporangium phraense]|uniref:hypothetical protein n=1 Tax=Cryptosporangium phraense TaxID=2593070 RepID=UPI001F0FED80|nr:hypothetical protein [Cryptosporangium phraense]